VELAAFVIAEINGVCDEATYAQYCEAVSANLAAAGGQYLVRGGAELKPMRQRSTNTKMVIVEGLPNV
jgi:uncharacterized protein (DUF1330 family)